MFSKGQIKFFQMAPQTFQIGARSVSSSTTIYNRADISFVYGKGAPSIIDAN